MPNSVWPSSCRWTPAGELTASALHDAAADSLQLCEQNELSVTLLQAPVFSDKPDQFLGWQCKPKVSPWVDGRAGMRPDNELYCFCI